MSAGVEAKVYQIAITTEEMRALDSDERQLVLLIGHAANEIAALYRAAHASGMAFALFRSAPQP